MWISGSESFIRLAKYKVSRWCSPFATLSFPVSNFICLMSSACVLFMTDQGAWLGIFVAFPSPANAARNVTWHLNRKKMCWFHTFIRSFLMNCHIHFKINISSLRSYTNEQHVEPVNLCLDPFFENTPRWRANSTAARQCLIDMENPVAKQRLPIPSKTLGAPNNFRQASKWRPSWPTQPQKCRAKDRACHSRCFFGSKLGICEICGISMHFMSRHINDRLLYASDSRELSQAWHGNLQSCTNQAGSLPFTFNNFLQPLSWSKSLKTLFTDSAVRL